jgi:hypothetical protein
MTGETFQKILLDAGETPIIGGWRKHIDDDHDKEGGIQFSW